MGELHLEIYSQVRHFNPGAHHFPLFESLFLFSIFDDLSTSIISTLVSKHPSSLVCVFCVDSEDGEGIQLSLCDGEAQSGVQGDHHQSCIVSVDVHTLYFC